MPKAASGFGLPIGLTDDTPSATTARARAVASTGPRTAVPATRRSSLNETASRVARRTTR